MATEDAAARLYDESIIIDGLNVSNWQSPAVYRSLHAGCVTAINATIAVWEDYRTTLDHVATWLRRFEKRQDTFLQVGSVQGHPPSQAAGKVGVIFGWQNATPIENNLDRLALFHALGVRVIQLTYNDRNLLGNGCYERSDDGLSHFGRDAVREMNRLGILSDLSHVGDRTTLRPSNTPNGPSPSPTPTPAPSFTMSATRRTKRCTYWPSRGGVIGANAFPSFLRRGFDSTTADYVDAIEDLIERVGIDTSASARTTPRTSPRPSSIGSSPNKAPSSASAANPSPILSSIRKAWKHPIGYPMSPASCSAGATTRRR